MTSQTKKVKEEYPSVERSSKIIYAFLIFSAVLPELSFAIALLFTDRLLEFGLVNLGGIIVAVFSNYSLAGILRKNPSLRIYVREELWILIVVLVITSFGVHDPFGISIGNVTSLAGPSLLLGGSFLILIVSINAVNRIRHWERIGLRTSEIPALISKLDSIFYGKEHQEISSVYRNAGYLPLLFVTEQMNLILVLVSGLFDKLIDESFRILNVPIPKDDKGREPGYVKKATYLGLNLSLDDSNFSFDKFWGVRSKYVHPALDKTTEMVPSEIEVENSIKLISKTLREYVRIISEFDSAKAS